MKQNRLRRRLCLKRQWPRRRLRLPQRQRLPQLTLLHKENRRLSRRRSLFLVGWGAAGKPIWYYFRYGYGNAHPTDPAFISPPVRHALRKFSYLRSHALSRFLPKPDRFCIIDTHMNTQKKKRGVARGSARWYASRLEGVRKNLGITKVRKSKGARKGRHLKKSVRARASNKRTV